MLEVGIWGIEKHRSAEAMLSDPTFAPNLAATTVLADPLGILGPLQVAVARSYTNREFVIARCENEKKRVLDCQDLMSTVQSGMEALGHLWDYMNNLGGVLALASLKKPTHRRTLTLMKEILLEHGQRQLHEEALQVWGAAGMSREQVAALLAKTETMFDRALEVQRTATPFSFKLKPHLRPYFVEASQEMINEGNHREATFWILAGLGAGYLTLSLDAPDEERITWQQSWDDALQEFDLRDASSWNRRYAAARELTDRIFQVADEIVELKQDIQD